MKQGQKANRTGKELENFIQNILNRKGYEFIGKKDFEAACCLEQPIYSCQFPIGMSIYGTKLYCDFILHHPEKYPQCLVIEAKWQQTKGSTDEKYPYVVSNIKISKYPTIIVLSGSGYKSKAEQWLRNQAGENNLLYVFNMEDFQIWSNSDDL